MANKIPMGIGQLGFSNTEFKRKFRFTFELFNICGSKKVPKHYVKLASRPNISIEEVQIDFLNARGWIPGKNSLEPINVTYYDVTADDAAPLYDWLSTLYNLTDPVNFTMGSIRDDYSATGILSVCDGCGSILETWEMRDMFPTSINFGDVDYESSDISTIELTLRYSWLKYNSLCPKLKITPCCTGC